MRARQPTSHQNQLCEASSDPDQRQVEEEPPQLNAPQKCVEQIYTCSRITLCLAMTFISQYSQASLRGAQQPGQGHLRGPPGFNICFTVVHAVCASLMPASRDYIAMFPPKLQSVSMSSGQLLTSKLRNTIQELNAADKFWAET